MGRGRHKLPTMIRSALRTATKPDSLVFTFLLHEGDSDSLKTVMGLLNDSQRCILYESEDRPHLAKFYNRMYRETSFQELGTMVSMVGDDMIFESPGWDSKILRVANDYDGVCVIHGDDVYAWHGGCCINLFTTRKTVDAMAPHPFMCEGFPCDGVDVVWHAIGETICRRVYLDDVYIRHNHATSGVQDDTYKRLRETAPESQAFAPHQYDYAAECAANIKKALPEVFSEPVAVMMTTYERVRLLGQTVDSYCKSYSLPSVIDVFDDCSANAEAVFGQVKKLPGVRVNMSQKHLGCISKVPDSLAQMFANEKTEAVFVIDSDSLFVPTWWEKVKTVYRRYKDEPWFGLLSTFNMRDTESREFAPAENLAEKDAYGGFGILITREVYEKCIVPFVDRYTNDGWDNVMCEAAQKLGKKLLVTVPTYIQHTGHAEGTHTGDAITYATDFLGEEPFDAQYAKGSGDVMSAAVGWGLLARRGDIVQGSMIANALMSIGYRITWVILPMYHDLINMVSPQAKVVEIGPFTDPAWHGLTTTELKEHIPNHEFYINAQFGCAENHNVYIGSGLHPLEWLSRRVEAIMDIRVPRNWTDFLTLRTDKDVSFRHGPEEGQKVAFIFPGAVTAPALTEDIVNEEFSRLSDEGWYVRIVTEKRPDGLGIRQVRERYLYGFKFWELPALMQHADLFIGNDSGPAWTALYSDCDMRVYHKRSRVSQTNTYFSYLKDNAQDIVLEDV